MILRWSAFETISHLSVCPLEGLDLDPLRVSYAGIIEQIDRSILRLIDL